ncbi:VCBS repeat-containing protein, partial [bacterium]|nr:VCBS repeat-containing protein [bacterium]
LVMEVDYNLFFTVRQHALILNQGDGAFVEAWNINVGREIYEIIEGVADFNQDGHWDMLVQRGGGFSIRFIQPDGTLSNYHNIIALESYGDAAIGDWNGDGFPDIAINDSGWRIISRQNRGNGTFETTETVHLAEQKIVRESEWCRLLGAIDIDKDGRDEIAIAHENWLKFLRFGDNHLEKAFPIYGSVHQIFAGDFTEDGLPDILLNQGLYPAYAPGKFRAPTRVPLEKTYIEALLTSDFDGDGLVDIALALYNEIQFLKGHGDGTFDAPINYPLTWNLIHDCWTPQMFHELKQGNFDEDGHPDILLTGTFILQCVSSNIHILLTGKSWRTVSIDTGLICPDATTADFNGDGHIDLAIASRRHWISPNLEKPKPIQIWLGQGDATFRKGATILPEFQGCIRGVDLDGNGVADLIAADAQGVFWLRGRKEGNTDSAKAEDVNGTFESPTRILNAPPPDDIYAAHLDDNLLPDLVGRYEYARELVVWMQYAPGNF